MSAATSAASTPPAGWYPDPAEPSVLRYWDGAAWTTDMQPAPQPASAIPESRLNNRTALGIVVGFLVAATLVFLLIGGGGDADPAETLSTAQIGQLDAEAQSQVRAAQAAIEAYATDHAGEYTGATPAALEEIQSTLTAPVTVDAQATSYTLAVESEAGATYSLTREPAGIVTYSCSPAGEGACPASGDWGLQGG